MLFLSVLQFSYYPYVTELKVTNRFSISPASLPMPGNISASMVLIDGSEVSLSKCPRIQNAYYTHVIKSNSKLYCIYHCGLAFYQIIQAQILRIIFGTSEDLLI